jgi:hypothetical protein
MKELLSRMLNNTAVKLFNGKLAISIKLSMSTGTHPSIHPKTTSKRKNLRGSLPKQNKISLNSISWIRLCSFKIGTIYLTSYRTTMR